MNNTIVKKLVPVIMLILSPLATVAVFGAFYIVIQVISGLEMSAAVSSFMTLLNGLTPYFPYLTTIPMVSIVLVVLMKKRNALCHKIKSLVGKR
jgi:hypothetical protein